jgi:hypothetical protein
MSDRDSRLVEDFLQSCDHLFEQLRGQGSIREVEFGALLEKMNSLAIAYRERADVPKELAATLFDLSTALYSSSPNYHELFDKFCDKARDILN